MVDEKRNGQKEATSLVYDIEEWMELLQKEGVYTKQDLKSRKSIWGKSPPREIFDLIKKTLFPELIGHLIRAGPEVKKEFQADQKRIQEFLDDFENHHHDLKN